MTRIAYLIGMTGAGKGHVASQFATTTTIVTGDIVQHRTGARLQPPLGDNTVWNWDHWTSRVSEPQTGIVMRHVVQELLKDSLSIGPILAEAAILVWDEWRAIFRLAIESCGVAISEERIFWLDPPDTVLVDQVQRRGRPNQALFDIQEARRQKNWYSRRASRFVPCRFEDAGQLVGELTRYLTADVRGTANG